MMENLLKSSGKTLCPDKVQEKIGLFLLNSSKTVLLPSKTWVVKDPLPTAAVLLPSKTWVVKDPLLTVEVPLPAWAVLAVPLTVVVLLPAWVVPVVPLTVVVLLPAWVALPTAAVPLPAWVVPVAPLLAAALLPVKTLATCLETLWAANENPSRHHLLFELSHHKVIGYKIVVPFITTSLLLYHILLSCF